MNIVIIVIENVRHVICRLLRNDSKFFKHLRRPKLDYIILARLMLLRLVKFDQLSNNCSSGIYAKPSKNIINQRLEPPLYYAVLNDALLTWSSIIITKDDQIILRDSGFSWLGLIWKIKKHINTYSDILYFVHKPIEFLTKDVVELGGSWMVMGKQDHFHNYHHFVMEYLPTLRVFDVEKISNIGFSVMLPMDAPSFVTEYIGKAKAGIKYDYVEFGSGTRIIDKLLVCERRYFHNKLRTATSDEINYIRSFRSQKGSKQNENLLISRKDAHNRNILNLGELVNMLDSYNIKLVTFTNKDIDEQIDLMLTARNIIAPHGANLTNTIFANDANIIEISDQTRSKSFEHIAKKVGNTYNRINVDPQDSNYYLDLNTLSKIRSLLK